MLTLAIETSSDIGGLCLYDSKRGIIGELRLGRVKRHSASLMPALSYLLSLAERQINEVDFFTISIGPGSFTGLRVGLSTVKGLCFSTGKPLVAVSSLEAFAHLFVNTAKTVCPLFDARKKEVYGALFRSEAGEMKRLTNDMVCPVEHILSLTEGDTLFAGSGAQRYREKIIDTLSERAHFASAPLMHPLSSAVAMLGLRKAKRGEFSEAATITPLYIRPSEAELKRQEKGV